MPRASDWRKPREWRRRGPSRTDLGWHTFVVSKPFCAPARAALLQALAPYEVPFVVTAEWVSAFNPNKTRQTLRIEWRTWENLKYGALAAAFYLPLTCETRIRVPAQQAQWAEYLIERTGKLAVVGGRVNLRNREWAGKYGGKMPTPWYPREGEASIEPSCKEGHAIWRAVQEAARRGR